MIIHLTFPNIPIHFNKLIGPACYVDSVNLLIFKGTLLEVIEYVAFYWDLLFSKTYKIENKWLFNFGYLISGNMSVLLKHSNEYDKGEKMAEWIKKNKKFTGCQLTSTGEWIKG